MEKAHPTRWAFFMGEAGGPGLPPMGRSMWKTQDNSIK